MDWLNKGPSGDEITGRPHILSVIATCHGLSCGRNAHFKCYHRLSRTGVPQRNSRKSECQSHQTHAPVIDIIVIQSNLPDVYNLHWMIADSKNQGRGRIKYFRIRILPTRNQYQRTQITEILLGPTLTYNLYVHSCKVLQRMIYLIRDFSIVSQVMKLIHCNN